MIGDPVPTLAAVETFEMPTATDGVTSTLPPADPIIASVVIESWSVATSVRLWPPFSDPETEADARSVTRLIATAAPNPKLVLVAPMPSGSAFAVDEDVDVAVSVTSPVTTTAPPRSALVVRLTMLIASDPATDTVPPPEPELASASNESGPSPLVADAFNEEAFSVEPDGRLASLDTFARSTATPAPTPALVEPAAEPSAVVEVVASCVPAMATAPLVTVTAPTKPAVAVAFSIVIATAAATETEPADVFAAGVDVVPLSAPPFALAVVSALPRAPATWPSTPLAGAPDAASPGAPPAEAFAADVAAPEPLAVSAIAPALSSRATVAATAWFAIVRASETPKAAVDAVEASLPAVVDSDAVCVAVALSAPVRTVAAPGPTFASVTTLESETATAAATETPPPEAPVLASEFIVSEVVALRLSALAPVRAPSTAAT